MDTCSALVLVLCVLREAGLEEHVDPIELGARVKEREIEEVAIKGCHHGWFYVADVFEEAGDGGRLYTQGDSALDF